MSEDHDLSPYEIARLERIKRNEDRLRSLGLIGDKAVTLKPQLETKARKRKRREPKGTTLPTRSSKRLKQTEGKSEQQDDDDAKDADSYPGEDDTEGKMNYTVMPQEPDRLDDHEFQVYVSLRAWRLRRKNELDVEPYKICQNRTLCELIRRRRNEAGFALRRIDEGDADVEKDLLSVWGIGPSKASKGRFGWEMLDVIDSEENVKLLEKSRNESGC